MYSVIDNRPLRRMGSPIQISPVQCLFSGSPKLIAANHVFHHHPAPRHPPTALISLAMTYCHSRQNTLLQHIRRSRNCFYPVFSFQRTYWAYAPELKAQSKKSPVCSSFNFKLSTLSRNLVEVNGIEPMTSWLQTRRSPS